MQTLYIANKNYSSWSLRPWALMRALGIPFEEKIEPLVPGSCWDAYRTFSPNGRVPCLHDGDAVIWESLAIVEYLAERHEGVWPKDAQARAWARCAASEMHAGFSALRNQCSMNCGVRVTLNAVSKELRHDLDRLDELWNEGMDRFGGPFLAGDCFTAVDAFFAPVAFRLQTYGLDLSDTAMVYVKRLLKLDFMREWYDAALAETWREEDHDRQVVASAKVIEDLRAPATG